MSTAPRRTSVPAVLSVRSPASLRTADAVRLDVTLPAAPDEDDLTSAVARIVDAAGGGLVPGSLVTVLFQATTAARRAVLLTALDAALERSPDSPHGPERLNGSAELAYEDSPVADALHAHGSLRQPQELALVERFELALDGLQRPGTVRQLVTYYAPAKHHDFPLHCVPPLTFLFVVVADAAEAAAVEGFLDVHHRGRGRFFRDEYLHQADAEG